MSTLRKILQIEVYATICISAKATKPGSYSNQALF